MKTDTLNLRIAPDIKSALKLISKREKRSMSNMIDFLVTDFCEKNGVALPAGKQESENANKRSASNDSPSTPKTRRKGANDT